MKEQILIFELTDTEKKKQLQLALLPLRIRVKAVLPAQYGETIASILKLPAEKVSGEIQQPAESELTEPMLLFAGLSSARLDQVLSALRKHQLYFPYKAMLTPHNQNWTPKQLFSELLDEHKKLQNN